MIIGRTFVYSHFPKTGGTLLREFFNRYASYDIVVMTNDRHAPIYKAHELFGVDLANRFCFGFVRNPFDWYVSWWANLVTMSLKGMSFKEFMLLPTQKQLGTYVKTNLFDDNVGFMTARMIIQWFHPNKPQACLLDKICRMEDGLTEQIADILNMGYEVKQKLCDLGVMNTSDHRETAYYYDDELVDLVLKKDAKIFDNFGYRKELPE